ncbi:1,4-dihydroxy-2-naphthoate octaprenyltransferase [Pajaroellobacter abortibovis]|uniref:1,4-dihydroxy-2-naphthoate octaprenyltransferase n=1 Tax=Pajaroellobacter abortibovis TaxID=1882918 RepID=A0A1L6MWM6_9BACT|nr:1,4-dihydroxy-2-naphthoate octaprenyltransferase [Pajaroellobacter abortibovis]APR99942.1 1,4-dihydroxy-2-naphthoate octaprenyltransferase [Pajaroellobacter abortibovis]
MKEERGFLSTLNIWWLACRPATLTLTVAPVLVGTAVAYAQGQVQWLVFLITLLGGLLIQIATNLANDLFDYEKGADTAMRVGPLRVTQAGLLTTAQMRKGLWTVLTMSLGAGVYLVWKGGMILAIGGILSLLSAVAYTAGPYPLAYHGLGDLFVMLCFGFFGVCGTVLVQCGLIPKLAYMASVPVGAMATSVLVVNHIRDRDEDAACNKRTLVVKWGTSFGQKEYQFLLGTAYGMVIWIGFSGLCSKGVWLPCLTFPYGWKLRRAVLNKPRQELNEVLKKTVQLSFFFSLLMAIGLLFPSLD